MAKDKQQLDELSKKLVRSYGQKNEKDIGKYFAGGKNSIRKLVNRADGQDLAYRKLKGGAKVMAKEESEQLSELSKEKLAKYINKAHFSGGMADFTAGKEYGKKLAKKKSGGNKSAEEKKANQVSSKREKGIAMAVKKLAKEDVEELVASIVDQKPIETNQLFDKIMKDKLEDKIETYKTEYSKALFGGDKEAEAEIDKELETELDNLSDEELEYLSNLTDDELESILSVNEPETTETPVEAPAPEETTPDGQETS
jgi:hypothetical protein